jgi:hypothetical protein
MAVSLGCCNPAANLFVIFGDPDITILPEKDSKMDARMKEIASVRNGRRIRLATHLVS